MKTTRPDYTNLSAEELDVLSKEKSAAYQNFRTSKEKEIKEFFNTYSDNLLDNCSLSEHSLKLLISKTPGVDINSIFMPEINFQYSWKPEDNNKLIKMEINLHNAFEKSDLITDNKSHLEHNRKFSVLCTLLLSSETFRNNLRNLLETSLYELREYANAVYAVMDEIRRRKNEEEWKIREEKHMQTYNEALFKIREWVNNFGEDAYVQIYDSTYRNIKEEFEPWDFVYRNHAVTPVIETRGGRDVFILDYQPRHHRNEECKYVHIRNLRNHEGKKLLELIK